MGSDKPRAGTQIEATMRAWEEVERRLVPIIGEGGFRILFARSLQLTRRDFPWLARVPTPTQEPFADLEASLATEKPEQVAAGSRALLATFTDLLHALIGEALTDRLIGSDSAAAHDPRNEELEP